MDDSNLKFLEMTREAMKYLSCGHVNLNTYKSADVRFLTIKIKMINKDYEIKSHRRVWKPQLDKSKRPQLAYPIHTNENRP